MQHLDHLQSTQLPARSSLWTGECAGSVQEYSDHGAAGAYPANNRTHLTLLPSPSSSQSIRNRGAKARCNKPPDSTTARISATITPTLTPHDIMQNLPQISKAESFDTTEVRFEPEHKLRNRRLCPITHVITRVAADEATRIGGINKS